jgi:hypothetical protein
MEKIMADYQEQLETMVMMWLKYNYSEEYDRWTSGFHRINAKELVNLFSGVSSTQRGNQTILNISSKKDPEIIEDPALKVNEWKMVQKDVAEKLFSKFKEGIPETVFENPFLNENIPEDFEEVFQKNLENLLSKEDKND